MNKIDSIESKIVFKPSDFEIDIGDTVTVVFYNYTVFACNRTYTRKQLSLDECEISYKAGDKLTGIVIACKFNRDPNTNVRIGIWNLIIKSEEKYYYPLFGLKNRNIPAFVLPTRMVCVEKMSRKLLVSDN